MMFIQKKITKDENNYLFKHKFLINIKSCKKVKGTLG